MNSSKFCLPQFDVNLNNTKKLIKKTGNKGLNLILLSNKLKNHIQIPEFFIINTQLNKIFNNKNKIPNNFILELKKQNLIKQILNNKHISSYSIYNLPLSVSVRSSGEISMPGMMSTFLNVGLTKEMFINLDNSLELQNFEIIFLIYYLIILCYAKICILNRFHNKDDIALQNTYSNIEILQSKLQHFNSNIKSATTIINCKEIFDIKLALEQDITYLCNFYNIKYDLLNNSLDQILFFIEIVFLSTQSKNIKLYAKNTNINSILTAIIVQKMVYGNINGGTGVCFSKNPITGENKIYGEIIQNAQGDNLVSGTMTPIALDEISCRSFGNNIFKKIESQAQLIEDFMHYPQDIEFTIQNEELFIMQTRDAKMNIAAEIKIALDGYLKYMTHERCLNILKNINIDQLFSNTIEHFNQNDILAKGISANGGVVKCKIAISDTYINNNTKENLCLVRKYTSVEDYEEITKCKAILTQIGGATSHASIIARTLNKAAICGINELEIYKDYIKCNNIILKEGDDIIIDGNNGIVFLSNVAIQDNKYNQEEIIKNLIDLIDKINNTNASNKSILNNDNILISNIKNKSLLKKNCNPIQIAINADSEEEINYSKKFNIKKIGLLRTEHMLSDPIILNCFREFIISYILNLSNKNLILVKFRNLQVKKLSSILKYKLITCVRLFDPPLHEFFTLNESSVHKIANSLNLEKDIVQSFINNIVEVNPMLGNRGARLGVSLLELYKSQVEALIIACYLTNNFNINITVPFINDLEEFIYIKDLIKSCFTVENIRKIFFENDFYNEENIAARENLNFNDFFEKKINLQNIAQDEIEIILLKLQNFKIGTMIETPRSCYIADEIAKHADYFSFGTNDLTQFALSISRDDIHKISSKYYNFWQFDPFKEIDQKCVGKLIKLAIQLAKKIKPNMEFSICGEHAQSLNSINYLKSIGITTLSISTFNILKTKLFLAINNI
ncbi:MAG: putative PEP-binding protein [Rickettsiales bacterium]